MKVTWVERGREGPESVHESESALESERERERE
jgi:hypothetical protein